MPTGRPQRKRKPIATTPMSIRFPEDLRRRIRRYAKARGLEEATAIRVICAEHLNEIELGEELTEAEDWQLGQALETWERVRRGEEKLVPMEQIYRTLAEGVERARRIGMKSG